MSRPIGKIRKWLKHKGFQLKIEPGVRCRVFLRSKIIFINKNLTVSSQLSSLLHECGHVEIFKSRLFSPQKRVSGSTLNEWLDDDDSRYATKRSQISELTEEIDAWTRGELLANKLKIRIPRESFNNIRTRCLLTYVRRTARPKKC
jgi:hypothetical protein